MKIEKRGLNRLGIILGSICSIIYIIMILDDPRIDSSPGEMLGLSLIALGYIFLGVFCVVRFGVPGFIRLVEWMNEGFRKTPDDDGTK